MTTRIRVIVAAEPLLLAGCRAVLAASRDIEVVADCSTIGATMTALRRCRPHVLVVDGTLYGQDYLETCARVSQASPETSIAWIARPCGTPPAHDVFPLMMAVLPTGVRCEELIDCVRTLAAGRPWKVPGHPPDSAFAARASCNEVRHSPLALLTLRERQIVQGVASGKRNREIAESLGITPGTVKLHLHKAFGKLGVHSRLALFRKLVQEAQWPRTRSA